MTTTILTQCSSRRLRWFQYSLRTLLLFILVAGCFSGWLGIKLRDAARQREVLRIVQGWGGEVLYARRFDEAGVFSAEIKTDCPAWLQPFFGDSRQDVFAINMMRLCGMAPTGPPPRYPDIGWNRIDISGVDFSPLSEFPNLRRLDLESTRISDATFATIPHLEKLEVLNLFGNGLTDQGLEHLKTWTQ